MKHFYFIYLLFITKILAQDVSLKFPTTPEIQKFSTNIDYPIDLNTGGISYSVPLLSLPLGNNDIKLNLNYSSRGVKVGDISNEFGHDWSLSIPKISREVRGIPDEFTFGYLHPTKGFSVYDMYNKTKNGITFIANPSGVKTLEQEIYFKAYNKEYDLQADKFYFDINGKAGYFMFKEGTKDIILYPFNDLKIIPNLPHSILIIDTDGTEYHFGGQDNSANEIYNNDGFVSSWNLTQIKKNNKTIDFSYLNSLNLYKTFVNEQYLLYKSIHSIQGKNDVIYTVNRVNKPFISKIATTNLTIDFNYSTSNHVTGGRKIDQIAINKGKDTLIYTFEFKNYFAEIFNDPTSKTERIFLNKIKRVTDKIEDFYSFDYINPEGLPSRLSPKIDLWGYFNNQNYNTRIPSYRVGLNKIQKGDRFVNEQYLKYGILEKITLPEKGVVKINTEPNTVDKRMFNTFSLGLYNHYLDIDEPDDKITEELTRIITSPFTGPDIDDNQSYPTFYEETFELIEKSLVDITLVKEFIGPDCISVNTSCPSVHLRGNNKFIILQESDNNKTIELDAGTYLLKVSNLSQFLNDRKNIIVRLSKLIDNPSKINKNANGLRINSIEHYDENKLVLRKEYDYNTSNNISSGELISISPLISFFSDTGFNYENYFSYEDAYIILNSNFQPFLDSNTTNKILYSEVTEKIIDVLQNKVLRTKNTYYKALESYSFKNESDIKLALPSIYNSNFLDIREVYHYVPIWRQGLLKSQEFYKNNNKIKETNFLYHQSLNHDKYKYTLSTSQMYGPMSFMYNKDYSEQQYLSRMITDEYFDNGTSITTETNYNYDSPNHLQLTKQSTKNSKGETLTTEYQYPPDWAGNAIADKLTAHNRISEPLTIVQKLNENTVISAVYNEYKEFNGANGIIEKSGVFQKKGSSQFVEADRKITYNSYDAKGNLLQYTLENGIPVSIIWGYGGQYPVAKIEGSTFANATSKLANYLTKIQSGTLTVAEQSTIRALIPDAMLTSYTYKPLIGVTSITGPNGQTEYYNYDSSNRLQSIVNEKNEVIKTFEYNYKQP
ncbi:hypothetical protein [Empedobacter tilapiae]|uniref:RHS repeat protein n=1 Tax=Empedobacter tilapiae TaxID=2491114 RepID=A0A4Z1BKD5_9FLAO|nr:hypothetical protein [Empedobacter tilapiae]TGN30237.1 hypothetical protein E4J94_01330 [Empedobacter tilapiae]